MEDLPPGFRFYPTEEELVSFYLQNKLDGRREELSRVIDRIIPVLDIYEHNPWDLPQFAGDMCNRDPEQWFFFIPRQESEARGGRPRRLTSAGYWKATGSPSHVYSNNRSIGLKRTMVFYNGRAPTGKKTDWKMNEYKAIQAQPTASSSAPGSHVVLRQEFSLCRVYKKLKCLRAFDRRPPGIEINERITQPANVDGAIASIQNPPVVERPSSSPESSSSGGDHQGNPSQVGESSNTPMSMDEPFLDWENLNWYYEGEDSQQ